MWSEFPEIPTNSLECFAAMSNILIIHVKRFRTETIEDHVVCIVINQQQCWPRNNLRNLLDKYLKTRPRHSLLHVKGSVCPLAANKEKPVFHQVHDSRNLNIVGVRGQCVWDCQTNHLFKQDECLPYTISTQT